MNKKYFILFAVLICIAASYVLGQQTVAFDAKLQQGMNELDKNVRSIGSQACGLIGAIIGLISLGRAAWKFSNGEHGAVMSLLEGVIAIVLAQIAAGFFR